MDFSNRVAMVTGGTGALGSAVALDLLAAGASVAVPYRAEKEWAALVELAGTKRDQLMGAKTDITSGEEIRGFVEKARQRFGRIDFLICVAGGFAAGKSYETEDAVWDQMLDLNLRSVVSAARAVIPGMIERNFGRVVTIASGSILNGGGSGIAAYAVSKDAVLRLSEILADELSQYDIRVRCVLPGTMDTEANRRAMPKADFSKWVSTADVARVIHALLSDDFRAVRSVAVPALG